MSNYEVSTLKKGLQILDLLKVSRYLTLTEVSKTLQLNKTTAFRLLKTLEGMNYVQKKDAYYALNSSKFLLNNERKTSIEWETLHSPRRIGMDLEKNVYIGTLEDTDLIVKQIIDPQAIASIKQESESRSSPHQSALGKVIMESE